MKPAPLTLIQLIREQTMQNLLPILLPANVATLAIDSGLLRHATGGAVALPDQTRKEIAHLASHRVPDYNTRYFKAIAPLQQAIGFLSGGWWEIIVADAMDKSGLFRDLRWSVQVGDRSGPDLEEDIVAINGVELVYVSCKRGGPRSRLLPLLEEVRARAATLGGTFNRRFLAVRFPLRGKPAENLRTRARELGVRLVSGDQVYEPGVFARYSHSSP